MSKSAKVYIIILNYNGWKDTIECIESLLHMDQNNFQILVVDNDSPNGSINHLLDWAQHYFKNSSFFTILQNNLVDIPLLPLPRVIFIKSDRNAGFAAGNNIAMQIALKWKDFDYLWLLNNDTTVAKDSLYELIKRATSDRKNNKKIGIWGSKLLHYYKPDTIQSVGAKFNMKTFVSKHIAENQPDSEIFNVASIDQDYVVGASMFVSKEFVEKVGVLSEDYFLYFEELDWTTRGLREGFELGYVWSSRVYHKEGQSIGSSTQGTKKSELSDFHGIRSKIIFIRKFYPEKLHLLYASLIGSTLLRLSRLQFNRARKIVYLMVNLKS